MSSKIKRVAIFVSWPFNQRDYDRYGTEVFKKNGFEVVFLDFSLLVFPTVLEKASIPDLLPCENRFRTQAEAVQVIRSLGIDTFATLQIGYTAETLWIFKELSRAGIPYSFSLTNAVPPPAAPGAQVSFIPPALQRFTKITPAKLYRFAKTLPARPWFSKFFGIHPPRFWIVGGTQSPEIYYRSFPFGKTSELLWTQSLDYDIYLDHQDAGVKDSRVAIFLDLGAPKFLRDDITRPDGKSILTEENYYPSLCRFFDQIEKDLGMEVQIAAHPGSDHPERPDYFGGRLTLRGQTCQMIARSGLVITHASTAISYAVLFEKPILFITTREITGVPALDIISFAADFGKKPLDIDKSMSADWSQELKVDPTQYERYKNRYIKKTGSPVEKSWQIVADRLKTLT